MKSKWLGMENFENFEKFEILTLCFAFRCASLSPTRGWPPLSRLPLTEPTIRERDIFVIPNVRIRPTFTKEFIHIGEYQLLMVMMIKRGKRFGKYSFLQIPSRRSDAPVTRTRRSNIVRELTLESDTGMHQRDLDQWVNSRFCNRGKEEMRYSTTRFYKSNHQH